MSIEKMYCTEPRKSLNQQLLFKVSLLRFHFASALYYFYYNEYAVSTASVNSILSKQQTSKQPHYI